MKNMFSFNSIELAVKNIKMITGFQNGCYFPMAIDAFNKVFQNMYCIVISYFYVKK